MKGGCALDSLTKSERLTISFTPAQKELREELAAKEGRRLPGFVRHAVDVYISAKQHQINRMNNVSSEE
jgi:hypothetical protein